MPINKKVKLKEDGRRYITKITTDDKGDISSIKERRTVKGFLTGAPTVKKKNAEAEASKPMMKKGGSVGKDKKWIQKAVNPKHKGYCTPMTKPTCTPRRKALAMTFKKMAKARKGS